MSEANGDSGGSALDVARVFVDAVVWGEHRKVWELMGLEARRGTERAFVDSPWQLPGEFVVATDVRLVLTHRYQYWEDFPPKTVLLGAIAAARH